MAHTKKRRLGDEPARLPLKNLLKPDKFIVKKLRTLAKASKSQTLSDLNFPSDGPELTDLTSSEVQMKIQELAKSVSKSTMDSNYFSIKVPAHATINQTFVHRCFSTLRKSAITTLMLSEISLLLNQNVKVAKEDVFRIHELFQDPTESEAILDDISGMFGCTRLSLNIFEPERGRVVGRLKFIENGRQIDCTDEGVSGFSIPRTIHGVDDMSSEAFFILLVDKSETYENLLREKFYNRFPCIIISGWGEASVGTRSFLSKMQRDLRLPVLALTDSDPKSLKMLSVFGSGPKSMSTPGIKWMGVRPTDLDVHGMPKNCRLPMKKKDIKIGKDLLKGDFVKKNPGWAVELERMMKSKEKVEIEAFSRFGLWYQTKVFLPLKLQQQDWL